MDELSSYQFEQPWTSRELEVVRLLEEGLTNREIAAKLILSPETVKWHNKQIFAKLGVSSRIQAAAKARELGLLDREEPEKPVVLTFGASRLPVKPTSFIGRRRELAEIKELLQNARLVTLTGPGGTGKTRLAIQVARAIIGHYKDGVTFVNLAKITDPALVPDTIAHEIDLMEQPGRSLSVSLANYYSQKHALLLLDNYEHVLPAARLVSDLLGAAPRLTILVTSREVMRLSGEHEYPVPPLTVPDPAHPLALTDLSHFESVDLFLQRARATRPDFKLTEENAAAVAAICARLEGLPLAIELAAARLKLFSPVQLQQRLESRLQVLKGGPRDLPARQRTLRDTIDWSYQLLEEDEKRLFWRMGVFVGGRTITAVETICGPDLGMDPIDGLESLLNKSLIYQEDGPGGDPRFIMLETIHEYALERLAGSGEERLVRDRHLDYFLGLAEEMAQGYRRENQLRLLAITEVEKGNLRAAFDWGLESGQFEAAARLISALHYFWYYHDSPVEGFRWVARILPHMKAIAPKLQPQLLITAGHLSWINGDLDQSRQFLERALALSREIGDKYSEGWSQILIAGNSDRLETFSTNWQKSEEGLALLKSLDDKPGIAQALNIQGEIARIEGRNQLAHQKYQACLAASKETGEIIRQNLLIGNLSMVAYNQGEYLEARDLGRLALQKFLESSTWQGVLSSIWHIAGPISKLGNPGKAARLLGASVAILAEMGAGSHPSDYGQMEKYVAETRDQLGDAAFQAAWDEGQAMTLEQAVNLALGE